MGMNLRKKLEEKIRKKEIEIDEWEMKILEAKAYIEGIKTSMQLFPKDASGKSSKRQLRPNSKIYQVREVLRKEGEPLHINEILKRINRDVTTVEKRNLTGSLGSYVRDGAIFYRSEPNTFGLIELRNEQEAIDKVLEEGAYEKIDDFEIQGD